MLLERLLDLTGRNHKKLLSPLWVVADVLSGSMARPGHQGPRCLALPPVLCELCTACCCYQTPCSVSCPESRPHARSRPSLPGLQSEPLDPLLSRLRSLGRTKAFMTSFISDASCAHSLGQVSSVNPISQRERQTQRGQMLPSKSHSMREAEIGQLAPACLLERRTKICDAGLQGGCSEDPGTQTVGGQIDGGSSQIFIAG